jgi:hypothetical protein
MKITSSLFEQLKSSLQISKPDSSYREMLKFEPGKSYQVRLLIDPNDPKDTFFHHYFHGWTSVKTGKYTTALCPSTFGERCPIDDYVIKTYRSGTEEEKKTLSEIKRKENWFVNVYVISDPTNPENEGKVKILKYGRELNKVISEAIEGEDAGEFGAKVFDLSGGCTLRIKCENRGGMGKSRIGITYSASKFLSPSDIEVNEEEVFDQLHNLKGIFKPSTPDGMQQMLDEHWWNKGEDAEESPVAPNEDEEKEVVTPKSKISKKVQEDDEEEPAPKKEMKVNSKVQALIDSIDLD